MPISGAEFDPIAIAVDWLDAGKLGDLDGLLDLHDERATLECTCEGVTLTGREAELSLNFGDGLAGQAAAVLG